MDLQVTLQRPSSTRCMYYVGVQCEYTNARAKGVYRRDATGSCLGHQRILISWLTRGSGGGGSMSLGRRGCIVDNAPSPPCTTSSQERVLLPYVVVLAPFYHSAFAKICVFGREFTFCFILARKFYFTLSFIKSTYFAYIICVYYRWRCSSRIYHLEFCNKYL
jgi:hypothetical protein